MTSATLLYDANILFYDNIKMDLGEVGCGGVDWIVLAPDRDRWWTLLNVVMKIWGPQNAGNMLTS
jgi:hypothetical protein